MAAYMKVDMGEGGQRDFNAEKYPKEITNSLSTFKKSLDEVEKVLAPLKSASLPDVHSKVGISNMWNSQPTCDLRYVHVHSSSVPFHPGRANPMANSYTATGLPPYPWP